MTKKIYFCAGHGKHTAGKRSPSGKFEEREWFFNDEVARAFESRLKQYNGVSLTRTDDRTGERDVPLSTRTGSANRAKADLYISFHHNAFQSKWGNHTGAETYYYKGSEEGRKLATEVQKAIVKAYGLRDRGIKTANLHITRETKMTAVLIEGGFMDSNIDIKKLRDKKVLQQAGRAVADVVAKYFNLKLMTSTNANTSSKPSKPSTNSKKNPQTNSSKSTSKGKPNYNTNSIVEFLASIGQPFSLSYRKKLAQIYGVKNYKGQASLNLYLLDLLQKDYKKSGKIRTSTPKPATKQKTISQMATEIINNPKAPKGHANRRKWLGISKVEYEKVRAEVNRRLL